MNKFPLKTNNPEFDEKMVNINKICDDLEKEILDSIRYLYSGKIKQTFLNKVYYKIKDRTNCFAEILQYYPNANSDKVSIVVTGGDCIDLDICRHIVGIHTYNMLFIDDYKRAGYQNDSGYLNKLIEDVIDQIKIRSLGSELFRKYKIYGNEDYLFYPPVYYLHAHILYLSYNVIKHKEKLVKNKKDGVNDKQIMLNDFALEILKKMSGIMALIDYDNLDSAYAILRASIELFATYIVLKHTTTDCKVIDRFNKFRMNYNTNLEFDSEFEELYNKRTSRDTNKIDYLNYGWIDEVFEYGYLDSKRTYRFNDLCKLIDDLYWKDKKISNFGTDLKTYFNKCHLYTHGNLISYNYPIIYIMDLCNIMGMIITELTRDFDEVSKINTYEGINIIKKLNGFLNDIKTKKGELTTDKLKSYYKNKKF